LVPNRPRNFVLNLYVGRGVVGHFVNSWQSTVHGLLSQIFIIFPSFGTLEVVLFPIGFT
jgi:hypothetical protein